MQKSKLWSHEDHNNTFFLASVCTTICHFSWKKRLKVAIFSSKDEFFFASDKRLKTAPLF